MRTSSMKTVEGDSGLETKDQDRGQAEIESIFNDYLNGQFFRFKNIKYE